MITRLTLLWRRCDASPTGCHFVTPLNSGLWFFLYLRKFRIAARLPVHGDFCRLSYRVVLSFRYVVLSARRHFKSPSSFGGGPSCRLPFLVVSGLLSSVLPADGRFASVQPSGVRLLSAYRPYVSQSQSPTASSCCFVLPVAFSGHIQPPVNAICHFNLRQLPVGRSYLFVDISGQRNGVHCLI